MPAVSNKPLTERVFEAWKSAKKSKAVFDKKVNALNKLSAQLDEDGVKAVEKMKEDFNKEGETTVKGKIEL